MSRDQKDGGLSAAVIRSAVIWLAPRRPTFVHAYGSAAGTNAKNAMTLTTVKTVSAPSSLTSTRSCALLTHVSRYDGSAAMLFRFCFCFIVVEG